MQLLNLIDKFHTWSNSLIKNRLPLISLYYYTKPRLYLYWCTQPVHQLIRGELKGKAVKKSVLFFTVHKSASTFFTWYLREIAAETGHYHIDLNGYFTTQGKQGKIRQNEPEFINKVFKKAGFIYGPLRNYIEVPELASYPIVLILRDPRDVLTSQYFSIKKTHPLVTTELIKRREKANAITIDEHVLSQSDRFVNTYNEYIRKVYGKENVLFLKYEELITDFSYCLAKINQHCSFGLNYTQLKKLDKSDAFLVKKEDPNSHKRKISKGDFREKLNPETIAVLNKKFEAVLNTLNYPI